LSDEFIHEVFIYGDEETIRQRPLALHQAGADEIVTTIRPLAEPPREEAVVLEILTQLST
jgi:hypothetical protein